MLRAQKVRSSCLKPSLSEDDGAWPHTADTSYRLDSNHLEVHAALHKGLACREALNDMPLKKGLHIVGEAVKAVR